MNITTIGIDLAKNTFSLHGTDAQGKAVLKKTVSRSKLLEQFANLPPCVAGKAMNDERVRPGDNSLFSLMANQAD